jgi:hypothetical protein
MAEEIGTTIGKIEKEAEKILEAAKEKARKTLEEGRRKSKEILGAEIPMEDIEKEKRLILQAADEESKARRDASEKRMAQVRATAPEKREKETLVILEAVQGGR